MLRVAGSLHEHRLERSRIAGELGRDALACGRDIRSFACRVKDRAAAVPLVLGDLGADLHPLEKEARDLLVYLIYALSGFGQ